MLERDQSDADLAQLLDQRFGDGLVYLCGPSDKARLREAVRRGFVDEEGYLTPEGYRLWSAWEHQMASGRVSRRRRTPSRPSRPAGARPARGSRPTASRAAAA